MRRVAIVMMSVKSKSFSLNLFVLISFDVPLLQQIRLILKFFKIKNNLKIVVEDIFNFPACSPRISSQTSEHTRTYHNSRSRVNQVAMAMICLLWPLP